jgi:hypothetical protein
MDDHLRAIAEVLTALGGLGGAGGLLWRIAALRSRRAKIDAMEHAALIAALTKLEKRLGSIERRIGRLGTGPRS